MGTVRSILALVAITLLIAHGANATNYDEGLNLAPAVREATRMESVPRVSIKIEVMPGDLHRLNVEVLIEIQASPFSEFPVEPNPLPGISDRVLAQGGTYVVEPLAPGVRHHIRFSESPAAGS